MGKWIWRNGEGEEKNSAIKIKRIGAYKSNTFIVFTALCLHSYFYFRQQQKL